MRKYLLVAAAAAAAIATPATQAAARDHSGYFGLEGGILKAKNESIHYDATGAYYYGYYINYYLGTYTPGFSAKNKLGYDIDAIAGYDFGMFRLEGRDPLQAVVEPQVKNTRGPNCLVANAVARAVWQAPRSNSHLQRLDGNQYIFAYRRYVGMVNVSRRLWP